MNWITKWKKIGIKVKKIFKKQPIGQQATDWKNCPQCKKIAYLPDLISNLYICECSYHFDLPPKMRLENLFDSSYKIIEAPKNFNPDPLNFEIEGKYKYKDKIKKYFSSFQSILMQVAKNGIINKKTASRKISRISKKI